MKHILAVLTVALVGAATTAFAAPQSDVLDYGNYSVNFKEFQNENNQGEGLGGYYTIKKNGEGSLYITNYLKQMSNGLSGQGELLTESIYGITHYGYIDSEGEIHEFAISDAGRIDQFDGYSYSGWVNDSTHPNGGYMGITEVPRDAYFLGNFEDGEEIQIYLARKDADGNVLLWTATASGEILNGVYTSRWGGRVDADSTMGIGQLQFPGTDEKQINFGIIASTPREGGEGSGTSGQPLPGGLQIAIIAGVFGLGLYYFRRRKAVAV